MTLSDLRPSISKMSFAEAVVLIGGVREKRRTPIKSTAPKVTKARKENKQIKSALTNMSSKQLQSTIDELTKLLEGK